MLHVLISISFFHFSFKLIINDVILGEPPKKKKKPNQSNLTGITSEEIKWYSNRRPVGKWKLLKKLKVSFIFVSKT